MSDSYRDSIEGVRLAEIARLSDELEQAHTESGMLRGDTEALRAEIARLTSRIATQAEIIQVWSKMLDDMDILSSRVKDLEEAGRVALGVLEIGNQWGAAKKLRKVLDKGMP